MHDYITTFSGVQIVPTDPNPNDIHIIDIANALSYMTRANGHMPEFYSVGQHSIACCKEAIARNYSNRVALAVLLHDASEAYLSDITRPVKKHLPQYRIFESNFQEIVYNKYLGSSLSKEEITLIDDLDHTMLYNEFKFYKNIELDMEHSTLITQPAFRFVEFKEVKEEFIKLYNQLKIVK